MTRTTQTKMKTTKKRINDSLDTLRGSSKITLKVALQPAQQKR